MRRKTEFLAMRCQFFEVSLPLHLDHGRAPAQFLRRGQCPLEPCAQQRGRWGMSRLVLILILVSCCLLSQSTATAPVKAVRRVLPIDSLRPSYRFTAGIDAAISTVLSQPAKTLDAALQQQPGTKHMVVVGGVGFSGAGCGGCSWDPPSS